MKKYFFLVLALFLATTTVKAIDTDTLSQKKVTIQICPVPNDGLFDILVDYQENIFSITIYSMLGEKVYEKNFITSDNKRISIDLRATQKGIYCLMYKDKSRTIREKVIIN